ncbi:SCO5918 family protein [Streptomyces sp. P5_D11]
MRCVIARFPFDLFKSEVMDSMKGIKPEPVTGDSVVIGRRVYPVKQVGEVITRQDGRRAGGGAARPAPRPFRACVPNGPTPTAHRRPRPPRTPRPAPPPRWPPR